MLNRGLVKLTENIYKLVLALDVYRLVQSHSKVMLTACLGLVFYLFYSFFTF